MINVFILIVNRTENVIDKLIRQFNCELTNLTKIMKKDEQRLLSLVNERLDLNLKENDLPYARFDAYNKSIVAELKCRDKHYTDTLIEFSKFSFNIRYSELAKCVFYYIVSMPKDNNTEQVYVFDVSGLAVSGYDFKWGWKEMPFSTEFGSSSKTKKLVGYLDISQAIGTFVVNNN